MLHHAVTAALVYVFIGTLCLVLLNALGIIDRSHAARLARGEGAPVAATYLAMAAAVLLWPRIAMVIVMHPKKIVALFAQNARGRG